MLQRKDVAFLKAMASKRRGKKRTKVPAGKRCTTSGGIALYRTTGKRKANELTSSGDY
jgi:hypothetical protein